MSLSPGSTIGPFKIQSLIGKGGMGEVYSALDTRLNRSVALKVLPQEFATDADRLRRFQLEARTLATLNHPNVALLFGFEAHASQNLLVLELVEGETLADRLKRGPLTLEEALHIAVQVASGLEAAHEKGIIHRDLKPANIKIAPEDRAKVLDFGLAKLITPDGSGSATVLSDSPTILTGSTLPGVVLGTAAYMSPEQAKGKIVDKRTDIWSFGCVLYECLTAKRAFDGESITECLGAILHKEPDWSVLPPHTPTQLQVLLRRCLSRDRAKRLHDIGDARLELESLLSGSPEMFSAPPAPAAPRRTFTPLATLLSGLLLGAVATAFLLSRRQTTLQNTTPPRQSLIRVPGVLRSPASSFKISPDGLRLAYISDDRVFIRKLTEPESSAQAIAQSEHAMALFWSPDSQWLGFSVEKKLFRVHVEESQPQPITEAPDALGPGSGAAWLRDNTIVFSAGTGTNGLLQVLATGGISKPFLRQNPEIDHDFHEPSSLPDGKTVLFTVHRGTNGVNGLIDTLAVSSGGTRKTVYTHSGRAPIASATYSPSGHILFDTQQNDIWAIPFSLSKLEATGEAVLVYSQSSHPTISSDGTLILNSGSARVASHLTSVDRTGKALLKFGPTQFHATFPPRWSSDGKRILTSGSPDAGSAGMSFNLWLYEQTNAYQLTFFKEESAIYPAWSPNGSTLAFTTLNQERASLTLTLLRLNGGEPVNIGAGFAATFTSGGESLVYSYYGKDFFSGSYEIRSTSLADHDADHSVATLARFTGQRVLMLSVSPRDQFLAYIANESDYSSSSFGLYITPFPRCDRHWRVNSPRQPYWPVWRKVRDQLFLYFCDYDGFIYETPVFGDPNALSLGQPVRLFQQRTEGLRNLAQDWPPGFDVSADGQQFLIFQRPEGAPRESFLTMIQNFGAVLSGKK